MSDTANQEIWAQLNRLHDKLRDLETNQDLLLGILTTAEGRKASQMYRRQLEVLAHAGRKNGGELGVSLDTKEIAAAADVTQPHAYNLIDRMVDNFEDCTKETDPVRLRVRHGTDIDDAVDQLDRIEALTAE